MTNNLSYKKGGPDAIEFNPVPHRTIIHPARSSRWRDPRYWILIIAGGVLGSGIVAELGGPLWLSAVGGGIWGVYVYRVYRWFVRPL